MPELPADYHGREQTWLKHRVLTEYLTAWAHKLGSVAGHEVHLWYVDVFAGPWESQAADLADTSIAIGLRALNVAASTWAKAGRLIHLHAVFVEKSPKSFLALNAYLNAEAGAVDIHAFEGRFGDHVSAIHELLGGHPAFIFVDPTGWQGADLAFIAELAKPKLRDVLVNVMYDHVNRFVDDERTFLRKQMADFFGLGVGAIREGLDEAELMALYRRQLAALSGVPWVLDLAIPMPTADRTKFRLVVAGHHVRIVELFRDVEAKVIGEEAAQVRTDAKARSDEAKSGQSLLFAPAAPPQDPRYQELLHVAEAGVRKYLPLSLARRGSQQFGDLWPRILCAFHLRLSDLKALVLDLEREGLVEVQGRAPRERAVKDGHTLVAGKGR